MLSRVPDTDDTEFCQEYGDCDVTRPLWITTQVFAIKGSYKYHITFTFYNNYICQYI